MRQCFWLVIALISGVVAIGAVFTGLAATSDETTAESGLVIACCGSILFGAFSLYSLSVIPKIRKENRREKREEATLQEMRMLRMQQQVAQQQAPISEDDMQIRLASKLWKEGKKTAAVEILESMPHNPKAQNALAKIRLR